MKKESVYSSGQLVKFTTMFGDAGVEENTFHLGFAQGLFFDIAEALVFNRQREDWKVDRAKLRKLLGLLPLEFELGVGIFTKLTVSNFPEFSSVDPDVLRLPFRQVPRRAVKAVLKQIDFAEIYASAAPEEVIGEVHRAFLKKGLRAATIEELLLFSYQYCDFQPHQKMSVLALAAEKNRGGSTVVACISPTETSIRFYLRSLRDVDDSCRYLFVKI